MSCYKWGFKKGGYLNLGLSLRNYPHLNDHKYNVSCFFSQRKASWKLNEMKKFLVIRDVSSWCYQDSISRTSTEMLAAKMTSVFVSSCLSQSWLGLCFITTFSDSSWLRKHLHNGNVLSPDCNIFSSNIFTWRENASSFLGDNIFFIRSENYPGQCKWLKIRNRKCFFKNHQFLSGKLGRERESLLSLM